MPTTPGAHGPWPREISPGVFWLSHCVPVSYRDQSFHAQTGAYLVRGTDRAVMIDTGRPADWEHIAAQLHTALAGHDLDLLVPTHPELPHCGNLARLCRGYPGARVVGDDRDYHLFYPELADRIDPWPQEKPIDLGGGYEITLVPAVVRDLTNTQWAYETRSRTLFVSDGFACLHRTAAPDPDGGDDPEVLHAPGECASISSELDGMPEVYQAARITEAALWWSKYRPAGDLMTALDALLERHPPRLVAPSHGNVIDQVGEFAQLQRAAFRMALIP